MGFGPSSGGSDSVEDMELDAMSPDRVGGAEGHGDGGAVAAVAAAAAAGPSKQWAAGQELDSHTFYENGEYLPYAIDTTQDSYYAVVSRPFTGRRSGGWDVSCSPLYARLARRDDVGSGDVETVTRVS